MAAPTRAWYSSNHSGVSVSSVPAGQVHRLAVVAAEHHHHRVGLDLGQAGGDVRRPVEVVRPGQPRDEAEVDLAVHHAGVGGVVLQGRAEQLHEGVPDDPQLQGVGRGDRSQVARRRGGGRGAGECCCVVVVLPPPSGWRIVAGGAATPVVVGFRGGRGPAQGAVEELPGPVEQEHAAHLGQGAHDAHGPGAHRPLRLALRRLQQRGGVEEGGQAQEEEAGQQHVARRGDPAAFDEGGLAWWHQNWK